MSTQRRFNTFLMIVVSCLLILLLISLSEAQETNYWIIVDEHDTPPPDPPPQGWYYNCTGGDRGKLNEEDITYSWDGNSVYIAQVVKNPVGWTWGGMFYSLIRINQDNIPLDFNAIFGPYVKPEYQGEITEVEIVLSNVDSPSNNPNLELKLELKNKTDTLICSNTLRNLTSGSYPKTYRWILPEDCKQKVKLVLWIMDGAQVGDSVSIDRVRLKARVPDLKTIPTEEQAFLWTYSWLMANYNPDTGMVQDRSNFGTSEMENVSATAKAAKIAYYAYRKGYSTYEDANAVITKIASALINNKFPKGPPGKNSLWPHFTKNGGREIIPDTEWASGDTAYAALDVIMALHLIGDPNNQITALEDFLKVINWTDLLSPEGYISHGYSYEGEKISSYWQGFGMETIGVNWAYASATGNVAKMQDPPSDNGSGFIDNAHYPLVFSGTDQWDNNWDSYRNMTANLQLEWHNYNQYLFDAGLFGLSAVENPEMAFIGPMYRLHNSVKTDHIYTISEEEKDTLIGAGWKIEGIACIVYSNPTIDTVALYRLYDPVENDHIYTIDEEEKDNLIGDGWEDQGIACDVSLIQASDMFPFYRLYNSADKDHIYTTSQGERDNLIGAGWNDEGIECFTPLWYVAYGTGGKGSAVDGDGEVIALHYSGMIADIRPAEAISMWATLRDSNAAFLEDRVIISPLNNMESMKVDRTTGALTINHLKGSWNLALQAEGWALYDAGLRQDLAAAIENNPFLKRGYDILHGTNPYIIYVPADYPTIQQAIDAAVSGTTIIVAQGTYYETLTLNKSGIILQGDNRNSIIFGEEPFPIIYCENISGDETAIKGFKITNGDYGIQCAGTVSSLRIEDNEITRASPAGIRLENGASVVIENNYLHNTIRGISGSGATVDIINNDITWNRGSYGGGIYLSNATTLIQGNYFFENWDGAISLYSNSNATIVGNNISQNQSWNKSPGLHIFNSTATLWNNLIEYNYPYNSQTVGGGLHTVGSDISVFNNIFRRNRSEKGSAIHVVNTNFTAKNNIFTENSGDDATVNFEGSGIQDFCYNDLWGNSTPNNVSGIILCPGGNIFADPCFVDTQDFYLRVGSLCINAGDNDPNCNDLDGTRNDMGIYGGSLAGTWFLRLADLNIDNRIDFKDYAILAANWLKQGPSLEGDINGNGLVDRIDLKLLVLCWLNSRV